MVVKSKRGRRRYIAFRWQGNQAASDEDLLAYLRSTLAPLGVRFKLIQFDGRQGIFRVGGGDRGPVLERLAQADGPVRTLRTSGTLRSLREGVLAHERR
jgi:RNase P/RNase MRP subunit POP5